jgi:alkylated DNA repair dioxygenase AlkB
MDKQESYSLGGLFGQQPDPQYNRLPKDGIVNYFGRIFSPQESKRFYLALLQEIDWKNDEALIFGKLIITKRKVAWYGDKEYSYTYSNTTKKAQGWTPLLQTLKQKTEELSGETFNSCLLNLYHSGEEGMAWHSDAEKDLKRNGTIASLSFGAERNFSFKHKQSKETVSLLLENGSLLLMKDCTQSFWLHRLPPSTKVLTPRINLTFRTIVAE